MVFQNVHRQVFLANLEGKEFRLKLRPSLIHFTFDADLSGLCNSALLQFNTLAVSSDDVAPTEPNKTTSEKQALMRIYTHSQVLQPRVNIPRKMAHQSTSRPTGNHGLTILE